MVLHRTTAKLTFLTIVLIAGAICSRGLAQENADPNRLNSKVQAFLEWDQKNTYPENPVLFIGSSSIDLWSTREYFSDLPVINRGISECYISDINYFIRAIVLKYRPPVIVFYAGENDIAAGKSVGRVQMDFESFAQYIHEVLPNTMILFISLKPTLSRLSFWPQLQEVNEGIREITGTNDFIHYLDASTLMIDGEGQPKYEYFRGDGLHLNTRGYQLWTDMVKKVILEQKMLK